jgi:hypothetical protein
LDQETGVAAFVFAGVFRIRAVHLFISDDGVEVRLRKVFVKIRLERRVVGWIFTMERTD